jgi:hypothetical protein
LQLLTTSNLSYSLSMTGRGIANHLRLIRGNPRSHPQPCTRLFTRYTRTPQLPLGASKQAQSECQNQRQKKKMNDAENDHLFEMAMLHAQISTSTSASTSTSRSTSPPSPPSPPSRTSLRSDVISHEENENEWMSNDAEIHANYGRHG